MKRSIKALLVIMVINGGVGASIAYALSPDSAHSCMHGSHSMGFGSHDGYGDPDTRIDRMADALDLAKAQRDAMRAIVDKAHPQTRELRDKLAENHKQLRALIQQGSPKESELRKLADTQGRMMADMIVLRTKVQTEIRAVLTDAQREQMQQWREKHGRPSSSEKESAVHNLSGTALLNPPETTATKVMM